MLCGVKIGHLPSMCASPRWSIPDDSFISAFHALETNFRMRNVFVMRVERKNQIRCLVARPACAFEGRKRATIKDSLTQLLLFHQSACLTPTTSSSSSDYAVPSCPFKVIAVHRRCLLITSTRTPHRINRCCTILIDIWCRPSTSSSSNKTRRDWIYRLRQLQHWRHPQPLRRPHPRKRSPL